eukprot:g10772.t1
MSRDLEHQSLESTFSKVAELEFDDDEDDIRDSAFPNGEDSYGDESDSDDSSSEGSVDLGLADDLRESDSAMQCVLEMEDVVNDLLGVKDRLLALYPLPTEVQLHLVVPLSKLTRLKNSLKPSVRYLQKIAKIFASGELSNEMVKHMRTVLAATQAELAAEKKRRFELDRKIHVLTFQSDHQHRQVQLIRWLKLFSSLRRREIKKAHKHKVKHLQHVIASLRRKFHRSEDKVDDLKRELQITKVEAEAMIKQAHQSRKLGQELATRIDQTAESPKSLNYTPPIHTVDGRLLGSRAISRSSNRPSTANTGVSSVDDHYDPQNAATPTNENYLYEDNDIDGMSDKMYEKPSSDIKATLPEQQAKEEEQRKAMQIQREFEAQFDKAMEKVKANHHKENGGIQGLDAREAFELYKQAAIIKEESTRKVTPTPKEASWHKRYFGRKKVEDSDVTVKNKESMSPNEQEVKITTNNGSPEYVPLVTEHHRDLQLDQAPKSKGNTIQKKNDKNLTEKMEIPAVEEKRDAEPTDQILVQNAGVINRLEMIVRGLEAQLRLKDHTIDDLRQKLSAKTNSAPKGRRHLRPELPQSSIHLKGELNAARESGTIEMYDISLMPHESLRPWTSTTTVRRNSKTNSMELPAKFIPIRMPPNQPYKQNRFKSNHNHRFSRRNPRKPSQQFSMNNVNFTNRIMQARRPNSQRSARTRSIY